MHSEKNKNILLIQTAFLGDVILATPIIEKLKRFYPECTIDVLVKKGYESLFDNNPNLNRVLAFDKSKRKYRNLFSLIAQIRKSKYDLVINLQRYATTGIITVMSGAKETVGFDKNPLSFLFSRRVKHRMHKDSSLSEHEVTRNLRLIEHMTDKSFEKPKLYLLDRIGLDIEDPYYCIAPTSVLFTKEYPIPSWIELIGKLPDNSTVYLLGAPNDYDKCDKIVQNVKGRKVVNLAGRLSLLESAFLMKGAKMNFVNDSGPLHIASAVNAPVRAIFCSTTPALGFGPLSDDSKVIETKRELSCRPCGMTGKKACPEGHFLCSDISTDDILASL